MRPSLRAPQREAAVSYQVGSLERLFGRHGSCVVVIGMVAVIGLGDTELAVRKHRDAVPIVVISLCMGVLLLICMIS